MFREGGEFHSAKLGLCAIAIMCNNCTIGTSDAAKFWYTKFRLKWAIPGMFFLYIRLFNTVAVAFNINFADD